MATPSDLGTSQLQRLLAQETEAVGRFVKLLLREQTALKNGTTEELPELAESKTELAVTLNQLAAQRNSQLSALGYSHNREGLDAWCSAHAAEREISNAWTTLLALAREAQELNRLNGELITIQLQYNSKALEALRSGHSTLQLYGPDGQAQTSSNRRINDAV